jgi:hypothetical protein
VGLVIIEPKDRSERERERRCTSVRDSSPGDCGSEKRRVGDEAPGGEGVGSSGHRRGQGGGSKQKREEREGLTSNDKFERSKVSLGGAYPMAGLAVTREVRYSDFGNGRAGGARVSGGRWWELWGIGAKGIQGSEDCF